jgi:hypothetical protein
MVTYCALTHARPYQDYTLYTTVVAYTDCVAARPCQDSMLTSH